MADPLTNQKEGVEENSLTLPIIAYKNILIITRSDQELEVFRKLLYGWVDHKSPKMC